MPAHRADRRGLRSASAVVLGLALAGCSLTVGQRPPAEDAGTAAPLPAEEVLCERGEDPKACTDAVITELRAQLLTSAGGAPADHEAYERALGSVVNDRRIRTDFGYERLTDVPELAVDEPSPTTPVHFSLTIAGTRSTWWACLPSPTVAQTDCGQPAA